MKLIVLDLTIDTAQIFPEKFESFEKLNNSDIIPILEKGYSFVQVDSIETKERHSKIPINLISSKKLKKQKIGIGKNANFRLLKNGVVKLVCVNGFLFDIQSGKNYIHNGLIIR